MRRDEPYNLQSQSFRRSSGYQMYICIQIYVYMYKPAPNINLSIMRRLWFEAGAQGVSYESHTAHVLRLG